MKKSKLIEWANALEREYRSALAQVPDAWEPFTADAWAKARDKDQAEPKPTSKKDARIAELEEQVAKLIERGDYLARNYRTSRLRPTRSIPAFAAVEWDLAVRSIDPSHAPTTAYPA